MVRYAPAVDIGEPTVCGAVDPNEEMGLCVDWNPSGVNCDRSNIDDWWPNLWRKDHQRHERYRASGHICHALRKQKSCYSES